MINNALIFIVLSATLVIVSWVLDRKKTVAGLKKGVMMFRNIALPFIHILILISIVLYLIPANIIVQYLGGETGFIGIAIAAVAGSITLIPGFISYPIAATLIREGASYGVVATFMTTLMMVGVITFPLEAKYFGGKVAFLRNALNFVTAVLIGVLAGMIL
jgi:uncharacterized membrane protein YraQ (UPF0718 family)